MSAIPDTAAEDALIPLSALQHQLFCPRQCALIHIERLWAEDGATAAGRLLHQQVDSGRSEKRGVRITRGLSLRTRMPSAAGVEQAGSSSPSPSTSTTQMRHTPLASAWGR